MNVKSSRYFLQLETWVKFGSIGLATILPPAVIIVSWSEGDWPRHVATAALLLAWLEMMFLLSRFPNWGYYVLMFGKVASNIVKVSYFTFYRYQLDGWMKVQVPARFRVFLNVRNYIWNSPRRMQ